MNKDEDFWKMVEELQKKIEIEEEETYSKAVIREYRNPTNFGFIDKPDASGEIKGPCGDTMKITLKIKNNVIKDACFWTDGCGATIACGNMLTKIIKGKTVKEASDITSGKLTTILGGLPEEHMHCSILAVNTLYNAIENYNKK